MKNNSLKKLLIIYFIVGIVFPTFITLYILSSWVESEKEKSLSLHRQALESEKELVKTRINEVKIALSMLDDSQVVIEYINLPEELRNFTSPRLVSRIKSAINEISTKEIKWAIVQDGKTIFKDHEITKNHFKVKSDVLVDSQGIYDPSANAIATIYAYIPFDNLLKNMSIVNGIYRDKGRISFSLYTVKTPNKTYLIVAFILLLTLVFLFLGLKIIKNKLVDPIIIQTTKLKRDHKLLVDTSGINNELDVLSAYVDEFVKTVESKRVLQAIRNISEQVSHDIKSPLTSLSYLIERNVELDEFESDYLLKQSFHRIRDIVNTLDFKSGNLVESKDVKEYLLGITLKNVIAEKKVEYIKRSEVFISLKNTLKPDEFVSLNLSSFQRAVSNIINNSIESQKDKRVNVEIFVISEENYVLIEIRDNGKGVESDYLERVFERGFSGKGSEGKGLGLFQVKSTIEDMGGEVSIKSKLDKGTSVFMRFRKSDKPSWFESQISMFNRKTVCVIDDDKIIHEAWLKKLSEYSVAIIQFDSFEDAQEWVGNKSSINDVYFLCDYKIPMSSTDGTDFIINNNLVEQSTLVTNLYFNEDLQEQVKINNMRMISKDLIENVQINIVNETAQPTVVLIDDDKLVIEVWRRFAVKAKVNFYSFKGVEYFIKEKDNIDKDAYIFIDSYLPNGERGEESSYEIYKKGYLNIFLATASNSEYMPFWIISRVSKKWPFVLS